MAPVVPVEQVVYTAQLTGLPVEQVLEDTQVLEAREQMQAITQELLVLFRVAQVAVAVAVLFLQPVAAAAVVLVYWDLVLLAREARLVLVLKLDEATVVVAASAEGHQKLEVHMARLVLTEGVLLRAQSASSGPVALGLFRRHERQTNKIGDGTLHTNQRRQSL